MNFIVNVQVGFVLFFTNKISALPMVDICMLRPKPEVDSVA